MVDHSSDRDLGLEGWIAFELYRVALRAGLGERGFTDLREADWPLVRFLAHQGTATVKEIAEAFGVTKQAASQAVASMSDRGYCRRGADDDDLRVRVVTLTPKGHRAHDAAVAVAHDVEEGLLDTVGAEALAGWRAVNQGLVEGWLDNAPERVRMAVAMRSTGDP